MSLTVAERSDRIGEARTRAASAYSRAMADDTYTVERSAIVDAPAGRVYEQISDFHLWPAWSPWEGIDPAMQRTYSGSERGTGAAYAWSGNRKAGR